MAKRAAAGTLALAVCLSGGAVALAGAANATSGFAFNDALAGKDRAETAAMISAKAFPKAGDAKAIVLANGWSSVDGLSASYVAGVKSAPVLFTDAGSVPMSTQTEMARLGVKDVYIVGGTTVVSASVVTWLTANGYTVKDRFGGADRYETSADAAEAGDTAPTKVFLASGDKGHNADALVVSPIAYKQHYPVLLTSGTSASSATKAELAVLGTKTVITVGGNAVISDSIATAFGSDPNARLAGASRQETATKVADWAIKGEGFSKTTIGLVSGANGHEADALASASLAAHEASPLLYTDFDGSSSATTEAWLKLHASDLTSGWAFGGKDVVSSAAISAATKAAASVTSNQSYTVTGGGSVITKSTSGDNAGVVQYTVSGLGKDKVDIVLADASNITDGAIKLDTTGKLAAFGTATGAITVVNGVGNGSNTPTAYGITPNNGSITFTVDSGDSGASIPVVFSAADGNDTLSVDSKGMPTEAYGFGGKVTWLPLEATAGAVSSLTVKSIDVKAGYFVAGALGNTTSDVVLKFKSTDTYNYMVSTTAVNTTQVNFLSMLSAGDTITATYSKTGASTFNLSDVAPTAPASLAASAPSSATDTSLVLTVGDSTTKSVASYNIYRSSASATTISSTPSSLPSTWTKVANVADSAPGTANSSTVKWTDTGLKASTHYMYAAKSVDASGQEGSTVIFSVDAATTATPTATTPKSTSAAYNDANVDKYLNKGDSLTLGFNGGVTVADKYSLTLTDGSGNTVKVDQDNSDVTSSTDGTTVVLSLTADPRAVSGNAPLAFNNGSPVTVEVNSVTGIGNATGAWNLAGSTVRSFSGTSIPGAIATSTLTDDAAAETVTYTATVVAGNVINVYSANGVLLGTATATSTDATNGTVVVTTSGITTGDKLLVTKQVSASAQESAAQSLTVS